MVKLPKTASTAIEVAFPWLFGVSIIASAYEHGVLWLGAHDYTLGAVADRLISLTITNDPFTRLYISLFLALIGISGLALIALVNVFRVKSLSMKVFSFCLFISYPCILLWIPYYWKDLAP